jgi:hypothetical protein
VSFPAQANAWIDLCSIIDRALERGPIDRQPTTDRRTFHHKLHRERRTDVGDRRPQALNPKHRARLIKPRHIHLPDRTKP